MEKNETGREKQKKNRNNRRERERDKKGKSQQKNETQKERNTTRMKNKGGMKQNFSFFVLCCWPLSGQSPAKDKGQTTK